MKKRLERKSDEYHLLVIETVGVIYVTVSIKYDYKKIEHVE